MASEDFEKRLFEIKQRLKQTGEVISTFGGVSIYKNMSFKYVSDEKLQLVHSVLHSLFAQNKSDKRIHRLHNKLEQEFEVRDMEHFSLDKLDNLPI